MSQLRETRLENATHCNACGCETATAWANCSRCRSAIGSDSRFCWKCGAEQDLHARRAVYGDRWHRSPTDFAVRVDIALPQEAIRHGVQVDDGTMALLFQDGRFVGRLDPGYHTMDSFLQRLLNFQPGREAHAVLLDMRSAEIDFDLDGLRISDHTAIEARVRLLFRVANPELFVNQVIRDAASFQTGDLARLFHADVQNAVQETLRDKKMEEVLVEPRAREQVEGAIVARLEPAAIHYGLQMEGVRLAQFAGPAVEAVSGALGEIARTNREYELNRRLRDASRAEKIDAFRDEQQMADFHEQVSHEFGFKSAEREQERKRFIATMEHQDSLEGIKRDYEQRRTEILNRLDEQKLRHESELADVKHGGVQDLVRAEGEIAVGGRRGDFGRDQERKDAELGHELQIKKAHADLEAGRKGLDLLREVEDVKAARRKMEQDLELEKLRSQAQIFGGANPQALLAMLDGEKADRLFKLAELEILKGVSAEQALSMVAKNSPDVADAAARAIEAMHQSKNPGQDNPVD